MCLRLEWCDTDVMIHLADGEINESFRLACDIHSRSFQLRLTRGELSVEEEMLFCSRVWADSIVESVTTGAEVVWTREQGLDAFVAWAAAHPAAFEQVLYTSMSRDLFTMGEGETI